MTKPSAAVWSTAATETPADTTAVQRFTANGDAYLPDLTQPASDNELRVVTGRGGSGQHQHNLLRALTTHIHPTIDRQRGR
jgi:hypothetical protein